MRQTLYVFIADGSFFIQLCGVCPLNNFTGGNAGLSTIQIKYHPEPGTSEPGTSERFAFILADFIVLVQNGEIEFSGNTNDFRMIYIILLEIHFH